MAGDVEVAVARRRRADADALVGQPHMHRLGVGGGVHGDGGDAQLAAGALDAKRDLAAVGDQDLLEHCRHARSAYSRIISASPYSTGAPDWHQDARHGPGLRCLDLVEGLHRLDQQQRLPGGDRLADGNEGRRARFRREIGDADHRAGHRAGMVAASSAAAGGVRRRRGARQAAAAGGRRDDGGRRGRQRAPRGCGCPSRRSRSRSARFRSAPRPACGSHRDRTAMRVIPSRCLAAARPWLSAPGRSRCTPSPAITPTATFET